MRKRLRAQDSGIVTEGRAISRSPPISTIKEKKIAPLRPISVGRGGQNAADDSVVDEEMDAQFETQLSAGPAPASGYLALNTSQNRLPTGKSVY